MKVPSEVALAAATLVAVWRVAEAAQPCYVRLSEQASARAVLALLAQGGGTTSGRIRWDERDSAGNESASLCQTDPPPLIASSAGRLREATPPTEAGAGSRQTDSGPGLDAGDADVGLTAYV